MNITKKPIAIFVIGGPGTGKGTQCKMLAKEFGMVHLSMGDILRDVRKKDTDLGRLINNYMTEYEKNGTFMPSSVIMQVIKATMVEAGWEKNMYLLDGHIKSNIMHEEWEKAIGDEVDLRRVIFYDCPVSVMESRLLSRASAESRGDDNIDIIKKRLTAFEEANSEVVEIFKKKELLTTINAENTIEEIFAQSKDAIKLSLGWN